MGGTGGAGGFGISDELMEMVTSMYIRRVDTTRTSATARFNMYDPFNYLGAAQFFAWDESQDIDELSKLPQVEDLMTLSAAPGDTDVTFYDLKPDTEYIISMGYVNEDGLYEEKDRIRVNTLDYDCSVQIESMDKDGFSYWIQLDSEMRDISAVKIQAYYGDSTTDADEIHTWTSQKEIELLKSSHGYEDRAEIQQFETIDKVTVTVDVQFEGSSSFIEVARATVANPFYNSSSVGGQGRNLTLDDLYDMQLTLERAISQMEDNDLEFLSEALDSKEAGSSSRKDTQTGNPEDSAGNSADQKTEEASKKDETKSGIDTDAETKPAGETKPTGESKPAGETKPAEETKPAGEGKPVEETKPPAETRPAAEEESQSEAGSEKETKAEADTIAADTESKSESAPEAGRQTESMKKAEPKAETGIRTDSESQMKTEAGQETEASSDR